MSNSSKNSDSRNSQPNTDTTSKKANAAISRTTAAGFGSYHYDPRYEELFKDEEDYSPNYSYMNGEREPANRFQEPFGPDFGPTPFKKTLIIIEQSQAGIRLFVQANPKAFLILLALVILFLSIPGIGEVLQSLVKSLVGLH